MNHSDVTRMAQEVGIVFEPTYNTCVIGNMQLVLFAELVEKMVLEKTAVLYSEAPLLMGQNFRNKARELKKCKRKTSEL